MRKKKTTRGGGKGEVLRRRRCEKGIRLEGLKKWDMCQQPGGTDRNTRGKKRGGVHGIKDFLHPLYVGVYGRRRGKTPNLPFNSL